MKKINWIGIGGFVVGLAVITVFLNSKKSSSHSESDEQKLSQLQNLEEDTSGEALSIGSDAVDVVDVEEAKAAAAKSIKPAIPTKNAATIAKPIATLNPAPLAKTPLVEREIKSLRSLVKMMALTSNAKYTPKQMIKNLAEAGLEPIMSKNSNEETGIMITIRTNKTLPGTRNTHVQYFEDENKEVIMQNFSTELRPSADSQQRALATVKELHPDLSKPVVKPGFTEWKTKDGYSVWVHMLTKEDIKEKKKEPYNAYSYDDVGTIIVAKELDIH